MDKKPLSEFLEAGRGERKIAFSSCFPLASSLLRGPDRQQERPELASPLCDPSGHFGHPKKGNVLRYFLGGGGYAGRGRCGVFLFPGEISRALPSAFAS